MSKWSVEGLGPIKVAKEPQRIVGRGPAREIGPFKVGMKLHTTWVRPTHGCAWQN